MGRCVVKTSGVPPRPPMAAMAAAAEPQPHYGTFSQRLQMYGLTTAMVLGTKVPRCAIPSLVPLLASARGWSAPQQAMLNSAFFQGYVLTQVPGGAVIQRYGAKPAMVLGQAGTAAAFLISPQLSSPVSVGVLLALMGLCQGPLGPGWSALNVAWMPKGSIEQTWALRALGLAHTMSPLFAAWLVPRLVRLGDIGRAWTVLGGFATAVTAAYALLARSTPPPAATTSTITTASVTAPQQEAKKDWGEWGILAVPAVHSFMGMMIGEGSASLMVLQWAPGRQQNGLFHQAFLSSRVIVLPRQTRDKHT